MRIVDNVSGWNVRVIQTVIGFMFVMVRVSVVVSVSRCSMHEGEREKQEVRQLYVHSLTLT